MIGELIPTGYTYDSGRTAINYAFSAATEFNVITGQTYYSGATPLETIILNLAGNINIQSGLNTYTGGTASLPTINISGLTVDNITVTGNSTFSALTATSIYATTIYSGGTDLSQLIGSGGVTVTPYIAIIDAASISWALSSSTNAEVTLTGASGTLSIVGATNGDTGILKVVQDLVGSRTMNLPANSKVVNGGGGSISFTTNPSAEDIISFTYDGTDFYWNVGNYYT